MLMQDGTVLCENDEEVLATEFCVECNIPLCVECANVLHKSVVKKTHKRVPLKTKVICDNDEEKEAVVFCLQCSQHFCHACDMVIHKHSSKKSHTRKTIDTEAAFPLSLPCPPSLFSPPSLPSPPCLSSLPPLPSPHTLKFLDRYEIKGISDFGGMNEVRKGVDIHTGQKVALKFVSNDASFINEITMLKKLRGEHVVSLIGTHPIAEIQAKEGPQNANTNVVVLERLKETLHERRQRRKLDFMEIRHMMFQIATCLEFLHSHNVVHCDVKPQNIMCDKHATWKLIDLDHATEIGQPISGNTPHYSSPEAIGSDKCKADPSMDVWAFGVILLELITGVSLYQSMTDSEIVAALTSKNFKLPIAKVPDEQARHLLQKILLYDPAERASITEIRRHAYFTGGLDTKQKEGNITNITNRLDNLKKDTEAIINKVDALRTQLLETSEYVIPRLFIVIPTALGKKSWANPNLWGKNTFNLHLLCEHDEGIHVTSHPGYLIADPKPFIRKAAPVISAVCKLLNASSSIAAKTGMPKVNIPDGVVTMIENAGSRPTEYLEFMTGIVDQVSKTKGVNVEQMFHITRGQALRELKVFLNKNDPGNTLGKLERIVVPTSGHVRWLCPQHADLYLVKVELSDEVMALHNELEALLHKAPLYLDQLQKYIGCEEYIRKAINTPSTVTEDAAWEAVLPAFDQLQKFYDFSNELAQYFPKLLVALSDNERGSGQAPRNYYLANMQSIGRQLVGVFDFVMNFDTIKMINPQFQNDLSYYRRTLNIKQLTNANLRVNDPKVNEKLKRMYLFFAYPTPMMKAIIESTLPLKDEKMLSTIVTCANVCYNMVENNKCSQEAATLSLLSAMVGSIILYDYISEQGAFVKTSPLQIKDSICLLKTATCTKHVQDLLNALRFTTINLNAPETAQEIQTLLA